MIQAILPIVGTILKRVIPDPKARAEAQQKLLELEQKGELAYLDANLQVALAQAKINEMEAKSHGNYKGGWRPFVGWVCGAALAWNYVVHPFLTYFVTIAFPDVKVPPVLDLAVMMPVLLGMLGLGTMRSYERREFTRETASLAKEKQKAQRQQFSFPATSD